MEDILLDLFGNNAEILHFFGRSTLEECINHICEKYENVQNFAQDRKDNLESGCSCKTINDFCNACYKISVYQDFCLYKNTSAENLTNEIRIRYDEIVRECNKRQINMNSFIHW